MKCCDITAGMLRHSVSLQRVVKTADGAGGFTHTWSTIATLRAFLRVTGANESTGQDRLNMSQRQKATIRYRSDLLPNDRILFQGKAYQIRGISDIEFRKKYLELDLESGVAT
jgi:SPP1 family predicted phage head-tail adaptor